MPIQSVYALQKKYLFLVEVEGLDAAGAAEAKWEGSSLVLTRGIRVSTMRGGVVDTNPPKLYAPFVEAKPRVFIRCLAPNGELSGIGWEIKYERALARGFENLNALDEQYALEAVCLVNAYTVPLPTA